MGEFSEMLLPVKGWSSPEAPGTVELPQAELQSVHRTIPSLLLGTGEMSAENVIPIRLVLVWAVCAEEFWPATALLRIAEGILRVNSTFQNAYT